VEGPRKVEAEKAERLETTQIPIAPSSPPFTVSRLWHFYQNLSSKARLLDALRILVFYVIDFSGLGVGGRVATVTVDHGIRLRNTGTVPWPWRQSLLHAGITRESAVLTVSVEPWTRHYGFGKMRWRMHDSRT
jgi:hypothetical protein